MRNAGSRLGVPNFVFLFSILSFIRDKVVIYTSSSSSFDMRAGALVYPILSLNAILLKQTMEKRHHIESLFPAKDALEAEIGCSGTENTLLRDELRGSNFMLKLENNGYVYGFC